MAAHPGMLLKHLIGQPRIECTKDRAIADTDLCIMVRAPVGDRQSIVDVTTWARFIDRFEKRDGVWKIARRVAIYEKDRVDPLLPGEPFEWQTPAHVYTQFPEAYRNLATILSDLGRQDMKSAIVAGTDAEQAMLSAEKAWLNSIQQQT